VSGLPILVEAAGLRVLVVGGGAVAARKLNPLVLGGARVRVVSPHAVDAIRALAASAQVEWLEREYDGADIGDAQLVIAATERRTVNAAVADDARAAHRLVNVADAPAGGSFAMMAIHRSGGLVIGVSAAGVPGAAARIRDAIARRFDSRYARTLDHLATVRRRLVDRGESDAWRALAGKVIGRDFCHAVEEGTLDEQVASWR
jgi:precorrin-2 dehydrogenase / sirohydrochlorin ferrochelatase